MGVPGGGGGRRPKEKVKERGGSIQSFGRSTRKLKNSKKPRRTKRPHRTQNHIEHAEQTHTKRKKKHAKKKEEDARIHPSPALQSRLSSTEQEPPFALLGRHNRVPERRAIDMRVTQKATVLGGGCILWWQVQTCCSACSASDLDRRAGWRAEERERSMSASLPVQLPRGNASRQALVTRSHKRLPY